YRRRTVHDRRAGAARLHVCRPPRLHREGRNTAGDSSGFFWTGDQVVITTATTSRKVTALAARPDVALAIDAGDIPDQARALSIRGQASVEIVDGVVPPGTYQ